ncbi:MAG: methyltransferase domain-containing protein [Armatimonadota bacterium]
MTFLTGYECQRILAAIVMGDSTVERLSGPDGDTSSIEVLEAGCRLVDEDITVSLEELERMARPAHGFFLYHDDGWRKQVEFSPTTKLQVGLYATETGTPALMVGGFPMHRHKGIDPWESSLAMVNAVPRVYGRVLDTTCGLGYVALAAAKRAVRVTTVEIDPAVCGLHQASPWSRKLYTTSNITVINESCLTYVAAQSSGSFDVIFHDPPTVQIAGDLYSQAFYSELHRVLSRKGVLFHYIGSPESRNGSTMMRGTKRRLSEAGFEKVVQVDSAFGLLAFKGGRVF